MLFNRTLVLAGLVAASFGLIACDDSSSASDEGTSSAKETNVSSSSAGGEDEGTSSAKETKVSSSSAGGEALDCAVEGGVKVVKPAAGESFKMGDTITVVYGSDVQGSGYRFVFKTGEEDVGMDMLEESAGPAEPDGKTCYKQKVVLSDDYSEPTDKAIIRVIPYEKTKLGANSATFKVAE